LRATDPTLECDLENRDACLGGQARGRVHDTARAQRVRDGRGERSHLDQITFAQFRVCRDEALSRTVVAAGWEPGGRSFQGSNDCIEGCGLFRRICDCVRDPFLEVARTSEQDFALVGEVTKEGAFGESGARGDFVDRGSAVSALVKQLQCRIHEPLARIGFPSGHARHATRLQ